MASSIGGAAPQLQAARRLFDAIDSNGDGVVTPEELDADFKQKQAEMIARSSERHTQKRDQFFAQDTRRR